MTLLRLHSMPLNALQHKCSLAQQVHFSVWRRTRINASLEPSVVSATAASSAALQRAAYGRDSFSGTSFQTKSAKVVQLCDRLRDAGVTADLTLDVPAIVVVGNQSAGKSSCLKRLSGVQLPRAADTCTRCPTEVRLSMDMPRKGWRCTVKLQYSYSSSNALLPEPSEKHFAVLEGEKGKHRLQHYITAAQQALLELDERATADDIKPFVKWAAEGGGAGSNRSTSDGPPPAGKVARQFTKNVVVLEISGAEANLTLIDLPGIIQYAEDKNTSGTSVPLIKEMAEEYMRRARTIIVATITCKDDINNQEVFRLAHSVDPAGMRTIGVLTKADLVASSDHDPWVRIVRNEAHELQHGYFVLRNPPTQELQSGLSLEAALAKEQEFFAQQAPWNSSELEPSRSRFGVDSLRTELSRQLVQLTEQELPKMRQAVRESLVLCEKQLAALPPMPSSDPRLELQMTIGKLAEALEKAVTARSGETALAKRVLAAFERFRHAVFAAQPHFQCGSAEPAQEAQAAAAAATPEAAAFWLHPPSCGGKQSLSLQDVRSRVEMARVFELPGYTPYSVLHSLIQGSKGEWDKYARDCVDAVAEELAGLVEQKVAALLERFPHAKTAVMDVVYELQQELKAVALDRVAVILAMEAEMVFTQNDHYFLDSRASFLADLQESALARRGILNSASMARARDHLLSAGLQGVKLANLAQLGEQGEDEEPLLEVVAGTLAYFKVASKRVIDAVPMHLQHYLLSDFLRLLTPRLFERLLGDPDANAAGASGGITGGGADVSSGGGSRPRRTVSAAELMEEEPRVAADRRRLAAKSRQLREAQKVMAAFRSGAASD